MALPFAGGGFSGDQILLRRRKQSRLKQLLQEQPGTSQPD